MINLLPLLLLFINNSFALETCEYSVSCDSSLLFPSCGLKTKSDSSNVFYLSLNKCKFQLNFCDVYDTMVMQKEGKSEYKYYPISLSSYTGGSCKSYLGNEDYECLYGHCIDGVCMNTFDNKMCVGNEDCGFNQICFNHQCSEYLSMGMACQSSLECEYNLTCYSQNCNKIYALPDGSDITFIIRGSDQPQMICESGYYYKTKDNRYICGKLKNVNDECRDDCEYLNEKGEHIHIEENCFC